MTRIDAHALSNDTQPHYNSDYNNTIESIARHHT